MPNFFKKKNAEVAKRVFPTRHPYVKNEDGSRSNVKLLTVGFDDNTFVVPTMVRGKQLSNDDAVALARKKGLQHYPKFSTQEEADAWAEANHGNIRPSGRLKRKKNDG